MVFFNNIFGKKVEPIKSYEEFWDWFKINEKEFFKLIKSHKNIEKGFFDKISPKLGELKDGYFYLAGMLDDYTAELVLTADGNINNIVFVEELVISAPKIEGWKFTALKPSLNIDKVSIHMAGFEFKSENLNFYPNEISEFPDEIDIMVFHDDYNDENSSQIINGTYIFLDNYLGELDFVNNIDNLKIIGKDRAEKELIPISKLKDYLIWRQKEFTEKYDGLRYDTENDEFSSFTAELENGNNLVAIINSTLLNWNRKASHPWISVLTIKYDGAKTNGMPNEQDYELLNYIEEELMQILLDQDGYLNIGRQTANSQREIYFACKDFRKPSKEFYKIKQKHSNNFDIEYEIYKDKYWQSFERFRQ